MLRESKIFKKLKKTYWNFRKRIRKIYNAYVLKRKYPRIYKRNAKKPLDENKVVFIEVRMPHITDSSQLVYDRVKASSNYKITEHYLRQGFCKWKEYAKACEKMVADIADAKYIFINDTSNVVSSVPMRPETVYVQLWHGCGAFKKFGYGTADLKFGANKKTLDKYPNHRNYSCVTVSAPEVIWAYKEAMGIEEEGVVEALGISRTDVFFDEGRASAAREKLYKLCPNAKTKKLLLYAPTFRGNQIAKAKAPDKLDMNMFREALDKDYVLLINNHSFVKNPVEIPAECKNFVYDLTGKMTIEELLMISDICISDYSSLIFEYSLFEKPMIFFAYDLDDYYDSRGFFYDYNDFVPGPILKENEEVIDYIKNIDTKFDKQKVVDFKNKYMQSCDGHATDRILEYAFGEII